MTIIVCLDDKNGMMFNKRRQSRDKVIYERIVDKQKNSRILTDNYSAQLFLDAKPNSFEVSEDFLNIATANDVCFVEDKNVSAYISKADKVIIYRFNRIYPSDVKFSVDLENLGFKKVKSEDFIGTSHDKLTEEVYSK